MSTAAGSADSPETPEVEVTGGGEASDEEVAAITGAVTTILSASAAVAPPPKPPRWRFSGRWWSKPVPLRRVRPGRW